MWRFKRFGEVRIRRLPNVCYTDALLSYDRPLDTYSLHRSKQTSVRNYFTDIARLTMPADLESGFVTLIGKPSSAKIDVFFMHRIYVVYLSNSGGVLKVKILKF